MLNLPNILSLLRIALIPVLVGLYFLPHGSAPVWATIVFVIAAITDWFDGYLARKWQQTSPFGAFIDPVADKLIVAVALVLILYKTSEWYILIPVVIIIGREITISALREWMAELGQRNAVKVSYVGKLKTTFQMISIACLIFYKPLFGLPTFEIGVVLLYFAAALTISSMFSYLKAAWPMLVSKG
ncbi:MAG: CDP-diacylglycerol--glycerol-3-phosphate 3-phosphatidyltransferase [Gammaproteobacteria bacterium]|nr:CDP-diacylglycerol--glycerol-3-phosphate 3-phosphatidyltransferase [Gammaproteobacteria bacterium]MDH5591523.1 CDP-diacylglycerol--glycerol-3-phosphate 3-phosphatidyltransferase [Gammaproteobacteria bacterium]